MDFHAYSIYFEIQFWRFWQFYFLSICFNDIGAVIVFMSYFRYYLLIVSENFGGINRIKNITLRIRCSLLKWWEISTFVWFQRLWAKAIPNRSHLWSAAWGAHVLSWWTIIVFLGATWSLVTVKGFANPVAWIIVETFWAIKSFERYHSLSQSNYTF